ncbi:MAG TPA: glycosyltransferase family 2 protein [Patescibacteria group bacterium]|nr:glycosyltransferase family 2 protein [Patescibacteria group bacterium]
MKLIVNIPALNEAENIAKVISQIPRKIKGINQVQVMVIDDGSTDKTVQVAKKAGADYVVSHPKNLGVGKAMRTAINQALKLKADIMVNIDADGQFSTSDIPRLIQPILDRQADFVTGSRFIDNRKIKNLSGAKLLGNKILAKFISWAIKKRVYDVSCGFRAFSREALLNLNLFGKFTYTQEMFLDLAAKDLEIGEVLIAVKYFKNRKSRIAKNLFNYGWQVFKIILRSFRDYQPLKFFGCVGMVLFLPGFLGGLSIFIRWLITHHVSPYVSYVYVSMLLMIVGFLLIVLALIAEMLFRLRLNQEKILYFEKKRYFK